MLSFIVFMQQKYKPFPNRFVFVRPEITSFWNYTHQFFKFIVFTANSHFLKCMTRWKTKHYVIFLLKTFSINFFLLPATSTSKYLNNSLAICIITTLKKSTYQNRFEEFWIAILYEISEKNYSCIFTLKKWNELHFLLFILVKHYVIVYHCFC